MIDQATIHALLESVGDDREFLGELIGAWLDDAPMQMALVDTAAAAGDAGALIAPAHTLKSTSAALGATEVAALARDLEHGARSGSLPDPTAVTRLRAAIDGASVTLRAIADHVDEDSAS